MDGIFQPGGVETELSRRPIGGVVRGTRASMALVVRGSDTVLRVRLPESQIILSVYMSALFGPDRSHIVVTVVNGVDPSISEGPRAHSTQVRRSHTVGGDNHWILATADIDGDEGIQTKGILVLSLSVCLLSFEAVKCEFVAGDVSEN